MVQELLELNLKDEDIGFLTHDLRVQVSILKARSYVMPWSKTLISQCSTHTVHPA